MAFDNLNDKQREACEHTEGPLLILAGAGSGKTSTMTHRIARMVERGIDPYNILAVTFTNKAANEMKTRVEDLIGAAPGMWVMTFHAMCLRMLRMDGDVIGYPSSFVIYDTTDQKTLVKNICKDLGISDKEYKPQFFLSVISSCKEKLMDPDDYKDSADNSPKAKAIYMVYSEYEKRLRANNAMDFDDLLVNCLKMFRSDEAVLLKYQERFRYVMVDEYQDTNRVQYELVRAISERHRNICVVGDDDQCIYEWRGADIRNILDFENDYPDAKVIKLEQNYRSTGNILDAAHSVVRNNKGRKAKKLWTNAAKGEKITYFRLDSDKDEAEFVTRQIYILSGKGRPYTDFAVLYRTNAQSRLFEQSLSRRGIPYRVLSGFRYYDRKEIKDIMAYMRLVVNPKDDLSFARIINVPKRGIGPKTVEKIRTFSMVRGQGMLEALADPDGEVIDTLPGKASESLKTMVDGLMAISREKDDMTVSDIYDLILIKSGYLKSLDTGDLEDEARLDNLMDFKSVIMDYENGAAQAQAEALSEGESGGDAYSEGVPRPGSLEDFMAQLTLAAEVDNYDETEDAVTLMTLHSAKGLEFPVVFMPGMEDGLFPSDRSFDSREDLEQERRLCYVGMTRAKQLLYLTSAAQRLRYGRIEYTRESQFLRELDPKLMSGDAVYVKKSGDSSLGVPTGSIDGFAEKPYKPYDALKYARMATKKNVAAYEVDLKPGDKVTHSKFGPGMVIEANDKIVEVAFDSAGIKKLAKGVAPLKKI